MNESTARQDYERAASLREEVMKLLEQHMCRRSDQSDSSVIVALQDAANRLGEVERCLSRRVTPVARLNGDPTG